MSVGTRDGRLVRLLEPVVENAGFDLEDLGVVPGRPRKLRVVVDSDAGVGVEDTAELTRTLSAALDSADAMGAGSYVLEVTSPGVDRPLTLPRHWRRATGRLVRVSPAARQGQKDEGEILGRVLSADDSTVVLDVDGTTRTLDYGEVRTARVQGEFSGGGAGRAGAGKEAGARKDRRSSATRGRSRERPRTESSEEGERWTST